MIAIICYNLFKKYAYISEALAIAIVLEQRRSRKPCSPICGKFVASKAQAGNFPPRAYLAP